jgi:hypothetical protein
LAWSVQITGTPAFSIGALETDAMDLYNSRECMHRNNDYPLVFNNTGTVLVIRQKFALEDDIKVHAFAPLEALPCVLPIAFLSGVHSLTGWHCKLRPNTEGTPGGNRRLLTMRDVVVKLDGSSRTLTVVSALGGEPKVLPLPRSMDGKKVHLAINGFLGTVFRFHALPPDAELVGLPTVGPGARPTIGRHVKLAAGGDPTGCLRAGDVGVIVLDDHVHYAVFNRYVHSRGVPLSFTPLLRLKHCHACGQ